MRLTTLQDNLVVNQLLTNMMIETVENNVMECGAIICM